MDCPDCTYEIPMASAGCPHCGRPGYPPNVRAAETPDERTAFEARYAAARADCTARGAEANFTAFETAAAGADAVMVRRLRDVQELAVSDRILYATYYQQIAAGKRLADDSTWDVRFEIEEALFRGYKERIHFAALSLDGIGLESYGDCSVTLRTDMIAHRSTVFVENGVVFTLRNKIAFGEMAAKTRGLRAPWRDRGRLAAAKHKDELTPATQKGEFPGLLVRQGATSAEDVFVEVHVYGPMTVRTFARVVLHIPKRKDAPKSVRSALRERLKKLNVPTEER